MAQLRVCADINCTELTRRTRCPDHQAATYRAAWQRRPPEQRTTDPEHRRQSKRQVTEQPWCTNCQQTRTQVQARGDRLEADHIIPRSAGGTNHPSNYQTLCGWCNASKGGTNRPDHAKQPKPRG